MPPQEPNKPSQEAQNASGQESIGRRLGAPSATSVHGIGITPMSQQTAESQPAASSVMVSPAPSTPMPSSPSSSPNPDPDVQAALQNMNTPRFEDKDQDGNPDGPFVGFGNQQDEVSHARFNPGAAKMRMALILSGSVAVVLIIVLAVYFMMIPNQRSQAYISKVTPEYQAQVAKMQVVYAAFVSPTFATNATTTAQDTAEFSQANAAIKAATDATNTLQADNHLNLLPGTDSFGKSKTAEAQYKATTAYVNDSQAFLSSFQTLVTYTSKFETISQSELPSVLTAMTNAGKATTPQALLSGCQQTVVLLTKVTNDISFLQPPSDLKSFQTTILGKLNALSSALQGIVAGIQSQNTQEIENSAAALQTAGNDLQSYNPNLGDLLQHGSSMSNLLNKLKAEKPLSQS